MAIAARFINLRPPEIVLGTSRCPILLAMQAACFPVEVPHSTHSTSEERSALLTLLGRQLAGGQAAIAAEAAERRLGGAGNSNDSSRHVLPAL